MNFESQYGELTTQIGNYSSEDIVFWAMVHLRQVDGNPLNENTTLLPWELLTLIRLGLIFGDVIQPPQIPSDNDMRILLNMIKNTGSESPILNRGGEHRLHKFLRVIAHQQMPYQTNMSSWKLGRQIQLFKLLPCKYPIAEKFLEYTGITIDSFFELSLLFILLMMEGNTVKSLFRAEDIYKIYPNDNIFKYLDLLSLKWESTKQDLTDSTFIKVKDPQLQFLDQTPFVRFPFIRCKENQFFYLSKKLFEQTVNNFVYDLLRSKEPNEFSQEFGKTTFENYLEMGLKYSKLPYITEKGLKSIFPENKKVVDFSIFDTDCTVLIECKAIEMKPYTRTLPDNDIMSNEFKSSVVKALEQIYSVANELRVTDTINGTIISDNMFALVVTYKELYFGPGQIVWDEFLKKELEPFFAKTGIVADIIPPNNIFYISLEGFDYLVNVLGNSEHTLNQILSHIAKETQDPNSMKFVFDWYVTDDFRITTNKLPYLDVPKNTIFQQIARFLGHENFEDLNPNNKQKEPSL